MKNKWVVVISFIIAIGAIFYVFLPRLLYYIKPEPTENDIKFKENSPLVIENFQASIPDTGTKISGGSYGIFFKYFCDGKLNYKIYSVMEPQYSWINDKERGIVIENIKFKCHELFARKLKETLSKVPEICSYSDDDIKLIGKYNYDELQDFLKENYSSLDTIKSVSKLKNIELEIDKLLLDYSAYTKEEEINN